MRAALVRAADRFARSRRERDFAAELDSHLALHIDDNIRAGMTPDAARRHALVALGGIEPLKERYRDRRGFPAVDAFAQDTAYAVRMLRRNPGFACVAVLTLALGIGANTAIFSVVNAVLLRPLPFPDPSRLVMVWATDARTHDVTDVASYPDFADWRSQSASFDGLAAFALRSVILSGGADAEVVRAARVTPGFFETLAVAPAIGRTFRPGEGELESAHVVVLSDGFWKRYAAAGAGVIGQTMRLDDEPHTIVGVMPPGFHIPGADAQIYAPLVRDPSRGHGFLRIVGRLHRRVSIAQAQAEMDVVTQRLARLYPRSNATVGAHLEPLVDAMAGPARAGLLMLLGVVGLVLLIACTNVANLMLARGVARQREMTVRAALGAGRGRLTRQLFTESLVLALAGGLLGLLLAHWTASLLAGLLAESVPLPRAETTHTDRAVLLFTLAASLLTAVLFGVLPALSASSPDLTTGLREAGRSAAGGTRARRLRGALVVVETALAVVLLAGAGVLLKTLMTMRSAQAGFQTEHLLVADFRVPQTTLKTLSDRAIFYNGLLTKVRRLSGVQAAALVADLPLGGGADGLGFHIPGRPDPAPGAFFTAGFNVATAGYFRTMRIPLRQGREFSGQDTAGVPAVLVINETAARRFWPGASAVGQQIALPGSGKTPLTLTVVGVTGDVRHTGLAAPPRPEFFLCSMQSPLDWPEVVLVTRVDGDPSAFAPAVKRIAKEVNADVPLERVRTMDEVVSGSMAQPRVYTVLLGIFASLALALSAVGLYGLVSYTVSQRTHEMGIRVALGAAPREITTLVVRQGLELAAGGIAVGIVCAVPATRSLVSLVRGMEPNDPAPFVAVTLLLLAVALGTSYLPARRAARVDPMTALRAD